MSFDKHLPRHVCGLIAALVTIASVPTLLAGGGALVPLSVLARNSDAVVIGRIVRASLAGGTPTLAIEVEKSLKGTIRPGTSLLLELKLNPDPGAPKLTVYKERGIFFLQRLANSGWATLPLVTGNPTSLRVAYFALADSAKPKVVNARISSPLERVFAEVLGSLDSAEGQAKGSPCDLQMEYRLMPARSPALRQMFANLASSPRPHLSRAALYAALADGDEGALAQLQQRSATMTESEIRGAAQQLQYLRSATPRAIARLGMIAAATGEMRPAALGALARIHDEQSVILLAPYLDNPDVSLAGMAVAGLSRFANNVPAGEHHPKSGDWKYRTKDTLRHSASDEQSLRNNPAILSFWKAWWNEHRAEILAASRSRNVSVEQSND